MARRKPAGKTAVEGLRHRSAQRRNPPTEQTGRYMSDEDLAPETFRPSPTRHGRRCAALGVAARGGA